MEIDNNLTYQQYITVNDSEQQSFIDKNGSQRDADGRLKEAVNEFSAIFLQQVFKSMRKTLPDNSLIDGGFAEDVYTEMLDQEISKLGSGQEKFNALNEILYRQLSDKMERGRD